MIGKITLLVLSKLINGVEKLEKFMSKLLRSKFLFGMIVLVAVAVVASTADASITSTLRKGSRGAQVIELQTALGISPADGIFGNMTKAAVATWQASKGLVADGVFGAKSRAVLSGSSVVTTLPSGCTSAAGFSPTTGLSCSGAVTVVNNGPISVSLASNNPAAGTLVDDQATADIAHFAFNGTGTVTGITLQRIGVSADSTLRNVYLFDGATRLTDAASVSNNGSISFNVPAGLFSVNGSRIISVRSDIGAGDGATTTTSGQTVGVTLSSFATASGTVTVNISGNLHNIASATLAAVSAGTVTPTGATINPAANVTVWQSTLNVSQRDVLMKRIALRNVGSAPASAFQNFKLFVNGVQVATATGLDSNGYVTFDMTSSPVLLVAGSRVVRVDVDIVSGASRTVQFSLRQAADVDFVDSSYGVNIAPTSTPWAPAAASTISGTTGGSMTVEKDVTSPSTNLTLAGSDVNLGTFKLTAYGESIKLETLKAGFTFVDGGTANSAATLRNGRLMINGVQYGSTTTLAAAGTSFTTNYTVVPGTPALVEVHADIYDNDGTGSLDTSDTLTATLVLGASNATRVDSLGSFNVPAVATVSANTLAIASASITLSKNSNYASQNTTLPATAFKIGSYNLAGSSVEDVLLTTLSVDIGTNLVGTGFDYRDVSSLYPVVKNSSGAIVAQPAPLATVAAADNSFSINYTLAKNANATIDLYANLADDGTGTIDATDAFDTILMVSGTSMVSGQSVTSGNGTSTIAGQSIAYAAATLTASLDASSPVAAIVYDNQTVTTLAAKFAAVTAGYNLTALTLTFNAASASTIVQNVMLYDGATLVAQGPMSTTTTATFSGLSWNIPANTNKVLTVKVQLGNIGVGAGSTGANIKTSIVTAATDFTATNTSTGVSTSSTSEEGGAAVGSAMNAYAAIPTITQGTLASNQLLNTTLRPLLRFTMTGNGGDIAWDQLTFKVEKVSDITVGTSGTAGIALYDVSNNTAIGGTFTNAATVYGAGTTGDIGFVPTAEQTISGSKTYELRGTIGTATTAGDYVTVTLDNDSSAVVASLAVSGGSGILDADSDAPIIWSDMSAASHATTTTDWTSDFGIKNLPVSDTLTSPL